MRRLAALYRTRVVHRRPGPPRYRFVYRSFYLLLDLDAIDHACRASPLISRNRLNLLSFYDADHGAHDGSSLRAWADRLLAGCDIDLDGGRIKLLAMPRVWGYAFHPVSLFYCYRRGGPLVAVLVEVHNTFGERHCYVLHEHGAVLDTGKSQTKTKQFHVSPFFDRAGVYNFRLREPRAALTVAIRLVEDGQTRIATALTGTRAPLTSGAIAAAVLSVPLMTFKVTAAIHWQAFKLWLRGARIRRKPAPRQPNVS